MSIGPPLIYRFNLLIFIVTQICIISETTSDSNFSSESGEHVRAEDEIQPFTSDDYEMPITEFGTQTAELKPDGSVNDIHFYLYTRENPEIPDELFVGNADSIRNSHFIHNAPVKVVSHGFQGNLHSAGFPCNLNASYLHPSSRNVNVILVDWSILAIAPNYLVAVANVPIVAEQNAKLIKFLVDERVTTLDQFHLVGHSLGAHLSGDTGYFIRKTMGRKLPRITGLDPAKPLFELADERGRIDPTDAEFVDIIHTTGLTVGLLRTLGHADFYPSGGLKQNGCLAPDLGCDHSRAHMYYSESAINPTGFRACKCVPKILGFPTCNCKKTDAVAYMGEYLSPSARGVYYLETNSHPPYWKG